MEESEQELKDFLESFESKPTTFVASDKSKFIPQKPNFKSSVIAPTLTSSFTAGSPSSFSRSTSAAPPSRTGLSPRMGGVNVDAKVEVAPLFQITSSPIGSSNAPNQFQQTSSPAPSTAMPSLAPRTSPGLSNAVPSYLQTSPKPNKGSFIPSSTPPRAKSPRQPSMAPPISDTLSAPPMIPASEFKVRAEKPAKNDQYQNTYQTIAQPDQNYQGIPAPMANRYTTELTNEITPSTPAYNQPPVSNAYFTPPPILNTYATPNSTVTATYSTPPINNSNIVAPPPMIPVSTAVKAEKPVKKRTGYVAQVPQINQSSEVLFDENQYQQQDQDNTYQNVSYDQQPQYNQGQSNVSYNQQPQYDQGQPNVSYNQQPQYDQGQPNVSYNQQPQYDQGQSYQQSYANQTYEHHRPQESNWSWGSVWNSAQKSLEQASKLAETVSSETKQKFQKVDIQKYTSQIVDVIAPPISPRHRKEETCKVYMSGIDQMKGFVRGGLRTIYKDVEVIATESTQKAMSLQHAIDQTQVNFY
jgi:hypothetical protein